MKATIGVKLSPTGILKENLIEGTRKKREEGRSGLIFNGETLIPKDFSEEFLKYSKNKDDLGIFLSNKFKEFHKTFEVLVVYSR